MFQLADKKATYPTAVTVRVPHGAAHIDAECTVTFRVLPASRASRLSLRSDQALLKEAIAGWEDVLGEDGKPIPCTPENIERVSERPYFASAAVGAYLDRFHPRKNF